jgi:hypothetical protein
VNCSPELAFQIDIDADVVAVLVDGVGRGEAGEALREPRAADVDRVPCCRSRLARADLEAFTTISGAEGDVQRLVQPDLDLRTASMPSGQLVIGQAAGVERVLEAAP